MYLSFIPYRLDFTCHRFLFCNADFRKFCVVLMTSNFCNTEMFFDFKPIQISEHLTWGSPRNVIGVPPRCEPEPPFPFFARRRHRGSFWRVLSALRAGGQCCPAGWSCVMLHRSSVVHAVISAVLCPVQSPQVRLPHVPEHC